MQELKKFKSFKEEWLNHLTSIDPTVIDSSKDGKDQHSPQHQLVSVSATNFDDRSTLIPPPPGLTGVARVPDSVRDLPPYDFSVSAKDHQESALKTRAYQRSKYKDSTEKEDFYREKVVKEDKSSSPEDYFPKPESSGRKRESVFPKATGNAENYSVRRASQI